MPLQNQRHIASVLSGMRYFNAPVFSYCCYYKDPHSNNNKCAKSADPIAGGFPECGGFHLMVSFFFYANAMLSASCHKKMIAISAVKVNPSCMAWSYDVTARAAKKASLGAGIITKMFVGGDLSEYDFEKTEDINPNVVILASGIDFGALFVNSRCFAVVFTLETC
ncbi:MAG: hypothetical protein EOM80_13755 [Erysipelotrichia bacterium]|nr:hypothetical protein [Erysipelotrichia bacterium]